MFDNKERRRYYGLRVGDKVKESWCGTHIEGEVVEYGFMDNNSVMVKDQNGEIRKCVAEWCEIIQRVDEWVISRNHPDAIVINDGSGFGDEFHEDSLKYYGGYLIAESVHPQYRNLISAAPDLLDALQRIIPHALNIINSNHADYKAAIAAIEKATKPVSNE